MTRKSNSLDVQIARLKGIVNAIKMSEITESHDFAVKVVTTLSMIITKMEVPELVGISNEKKAES